MKKINRAQSQLNINAKYCIKQISEIAGRLRIFKLMVNNHCESDEFKQEITDEVSSISDW